MNHFIMADPKLCIGCHACEIACVIAHYDGDFPQTREQFLPRIRVVKNADHFTALTCRHCENAPCAKICPTEALIRTDGRIHLDKDKCIGCKACVVACPFGAISMADDISHDSLPLDRVTAHKCDLCYGRADSPSCVGACPTDALRLYSIDEMSSVQQKKQQRSAMAANGHTAAFAVPTKARSPWQKFTAIPRMDAHKIAIDQRKQTFNEIYHQFVETEVKTQGSRCISCGDHSICEWTCPLHNRIPKWIDLAKEGRILEAVELSHQTNSLPEITGRVCPQDRLCEGACTLNHKDKAVTIGNIERYITETALAMGWRPDLSDVVPTGKRVAIIGAGPAGLACADVLIRKGVQPVVFDRHPEIGGMLTFGIPSFKLDKEVMVRRRHIFTDMGIEFHLNTEVGVDVDMSQLLADYDAIFVGVGTYRFMTAGLENEDAQGVYDALPYLIANTKQVMGLPQLAHEPYIDLQGKKVVVLGGGDTAMDCLRTAIRQGATSVTCAYRRDEANMPGSKKEVKNAREEGVEFMFNLQPVKIEIDDAGQVTGIRMLRTQLGAPDAAGRRRPEPIEGSEFILDADAVIVAFGFKPHQMEWLKEQGVELDNWGTIIAPNYQVNGYAGQTSHEKIFAGGDVVRGADLVVTAIDDGRKAALAMVDYLGLNTPAMKEAS